MGGGAMIRTVARFVGAAAAGVAATAPSSSTVLCHASQDHHQSVTATLNRYQTCSVIPSATTVSPASKPFAETDDWEYPLDENWNLNSQKSHVVFAPAPTEEEVEEATNDLHAALRLSIPAPNPETIEGSDIKKLEQGAQSNSLGIPLLKKEIVANNQVSSMPAGLGLLASSSDSVYQAFQLLQTNSKVQDAVKSLARDPAVWNAVLNNEKVLELTQSLNLTGAETANGKTQSDEDNDEMNFLKCATKKVCDLVANKVLQVLDKVAEIVGSIFSSFKTLFAKDGPIDPTIASCMMLAVAVLLIVVVKRAPLK